MGRVREIYVGPEREGPMRFVSSVQAMAHKGLEGDRYAIGTGSYSRSKGVRDVTMIEIEALWDFYRKSGIDLHPGLTRRNFVTEGIKLSDLIGSIFFIGSVKLFGSRACPPCRHLTKLAGIPDILEGLATSGGIYAEVLSDGTIGVEDPVVLYTPSQPGLEGSVS